MPIYKATITDVKTGKKTNEVEREFSSKDGVLTWAHNAGVVGHSVVKKILNSFYILENDHNGHRCRLDIEMV